MGMVIELSLIKSSPTNDTFSSRCLNSKRFSPSISSSSSSLNHEKENDIHVNKVKINSRVDHEQQKHKDDNDVVNP